MGGAASKARTLPTAAARTKPAWAGARTGDPNLSSPRPPKASGSRTPAIDADSKDPQLLQNLARLGQVPIASRSTAGTSERLARALRSQEQSEVDAQLARPPPNKLHAAALAALLDEVREAPSRDDEDALAVRYGVDPALLQRLLRVINSPSVGETVKVVVDGEERLTMSAEWVSKSKFASAPRIASQ
ncbi:hypothetical protein AURDEDRAFT_180637 [Auricularia subglabra TFB-10046 SS5]|nr:hypothetical protein AURDEDRAFT_180637 [Auricularia subglabra TFB-10046 SS5]